ncbi:hypothetical protein MKP08_08750 [Erythrobacter sp. LQ02-29]|uniref:hypothetical protein n=1 Tax=Erythrobacter sp. LQ02-29 TaxID=2920384 RepID=UPI001F4EF46C|nr:hypothetical protein [Erythrobacter sp. LQ02-29]MCP9222832.1 hypothetical protein [Erythrobacter sp. LQ02-29]
MQSNRTPIRSIALRLAPAIALTIGLAACAPTPQRVEQTPTPPPPPPPVTVTVPTPSFDNWMDAPQTPGDWRYAQDGRKPYAVFGARGGTGQFAIECDRAAGSIALVRAGSAGAAVPMQVRTETADRVVQAQPIPGTGRVAATLNARDPLLDAMAFSKGRFAIEVAGLPTLYLPAWAEVSRVIEDCR